MFVEWIILGNMKRLFLIPLTLILVLSCHQSTKESMILNDDDSVWEEFPCWPFLQFDDSNSSIHYVLPISNSLPSTREWHSIWVTIHCYSYWRISNNKVSVESLDTSSSVSVYMHAKKKNNYKNYFYTVGGERDDICREAIGEIFNKVYPLMEKVSYRLTDECGNVDYIAIKNVEFKNGLANTELAYRFLLYPTSE